MNITISVLLLLTITLGAIIQYSAFAVTSEQNLFPKTVTDWATIIGELAVGAGFIFLILEYRNARIQRREDKDTRREEEKLRRDEEMQNSVL